MKKKIHLLVLMFISISLTAQTVKLKITYKDNPVQNSDITIKIGDASIGTGRTNDNGEVNINCSNLISKGIDVYGSKQTSNSTKKWDVKGYVVLDGNNFYHLKMEIVAKDMAEASGGFMSENSIAAMWGLTASGKNESQNNSSNSSNNNSNSTNNSSTTNNTTSNSADEDKEEPIDLNHMREENLVVYKQNLEAEIIRYERRIKKDQKEINEAKLEGKSQIEVRKLEIDKEIDILTKEKREIQLKETNSKIAKTQLSFEERKKNDARLGEIKDQTNVLKDEYKSLKKQKELTSGDSTNQNNDVKNSPNSENTENNNKSGKPTSENNSVEENKKSKSKNDEYLNNPKYSDDAIQNKSKISLKMEMADLKMDLTSKNFSLKTKSSMMSQDKLEKLKIEIAQIEVLIQKYENRLKSLEEKDK